MSIRFFRFWKDGLMLISEKIRVFLVPTAALQVTRRRMSGLGAKADFSIPTKKARPMDLAFFKQIKLLQFMRKKLA
jgi:hypothetical protein